MTKRKSDTGPVLPRKRAKLTQLHDASEPQTCDGFLTPARPLPPAMSPRLEKRKRNRADISQTALDEEPATKRARTNHSSGNLSRRSRSSSPELWSSIGYEPEQEKKPNPRVEAFHRAWIDAESVCSCQPQTVYRNPLPSPVPTDRDGSEPDGDESAAINATPLLQLSTLIPQPLPSPKLRKTTLSGPSPPRRKRRSSRRQSTIPAPVSSRGKDSQREPRQKKKSRQVQLQENNSSPPIETISRSRRSSRRSPGCELWYLNDNGIACAVTNNR